MTGFTHFTRPLCIGENKLVDDDVVRVDAALGQLLDQPLCLIQREELSDTHTDEGGLFLMDVKKVGKGDGLQHIHRKICLNFLCKVKFSTLNHAVQWRFHCTISSEIKVFSKGVVVEI